jgi:hypothetical protein
MRISKGTILPVSQLKWNTPPIKNTTAFSWNPNDPEKFRAIYDENDFNRWKEGTIRYYGDLEVEVIKNPDKKFWHNSESIVYFI